jgi:hypothetical protein
MNDSAPPQAAHAEVAQHGAGLLRALEAFLRKYAILPSGASVVIALWILASWIIEAFDAFPYLVTSSPQKRCGKTRVLKLLSYLCKTPLASANISVAALYRAIESLRPTLLMDEAQILRDRTERAAELHDLLAAAFERDTAVCHRMSGPKGDKLIAFHVYSPKALTLIGRLTDILEDRSVEIRMRRRKKSERVARFRVRQAKEEAKGLSTDISRFIAEARAAIERVYLEEEFAEWLEDRDEQRWSPLLAVLQVADPIRLNEALSIIRHDCHVHASDDDEKNAAIRLLLDIKTVFGDRTEFLPTEDLINTLVAIQDAPWKTWRRERDPLDARGLAKLLKPFEIEPGQARYNGRAGVRGYHRSDFIDAWDRYLSPFDEIKPESEPELEPDASESNPEAQQEAKTKIGPLPAPPSTSRDDPASALQTKQDKSFRMNTDPFRNMRVADEKSCTQPCISMDVAGVADITTNRGKQTKNDASGGRSTARTTGSSSRPWSVQIGLEGAALFGFPGFRLPSGRRVGPGESSWMDFLMNPGGEFHEAMDMIRWLIRSRGLAEDQSEPPPGPEEQKVHTQDDHDPDREVVEL